ncbi:hypothetical protein B0J17DRAFT_714539 [Rhizoctonia solani]|nr:hypothetical protein B0J17DRAFT_714539 [Rhizoctonia solani]
MPDSGIPEHGVGFYQQMFTLASEAVLISINTMRLHAFYPFWTSKAYHGLVELRLTQRISNVFISEAHLQGILQASPRLRIFEFGLRIVNSVPEGSVAPVRLDHLEVLNVHTMSYEFIPNFFQIVGPCSRPLHFSLSSTPNEDNPRLAFNSPSILRNFLSRTNITTVHANDFNKDEIVDILGLCPNLQVLAWDGYNTPAEPESSELISHPGLQSLFMIYCDVELNVFPRWINLPALKNMVFYRCTFYQDGEAEDRLDERSVRKELPGVNVNVTFVGGDAPNPIDGWELFDSDS